MKKVNNLFAENEEAVSPVIGVIMMIAITVIIAAIVAAFAFSSIGDIQKAPSTALVVEDAGVGSPKITIIHYGGDTITNAFNLTAEKWDKMTVKRNGTDIDFSMYVTPPSGNNNFEAGEEIKISMLPNLVSDETITVVYTPSGDVLQRIKIA